jgi:hypothetical protein
MTLNIDNPAFNVKGEGGEMLLKALELGFYCAGHWKAEGFRIDKKKGLVLYWHDKSSEGHEVNKFITPLKPNQVVSQVIAFLESDFINEMELEGDDRDLDDCDIDNDLCWRIYTETWGRIDEDDYAFLAITPSYGWISK